MPSRRYRKKRFHLTCTDRRTDHRQAEAFGRMPAVTSASSTVTARASSAGNRVSEKNLYHYTPGEDEQVLMKQLHPEAIPQKRDIRDSARRWKLPGNWYTHLCHLPPKTSGKFICVNGEHGLRRIIEKHLPDFFPCAADDHRNMCRRCRRSRHLGCIQYLLQKASHGISGSSSQRRNHPGSCRASAPYSPI